MTKDEQQRRRRERGFFADLPRPTPEQLAAVEQLRTRIATAASQGRPPSPAEWAEYERAQAAIDAAYPTDRHWEELRQIRLGLHDPHSRRRARALDAARVMADARERAPFEVRTLRLAEEVLEG